jgi:uncharacterized surface protein with fasciclin (FAS1) repeats
MVTYMKMKRFTLGTGFFCWALFLGLVGCTKINQNSSVTPSNTIAQQVAAASNATIFDSAMNRTGMDTIFSQPGPFTLFLAVNNTFAAANITTATLNSYPDSVVRNWIEYSTVAGEAILTTNLNVVTDLKVIAANGDSLFFTNLAGSLWVNGVSVVAGNIIASNGVIDITSYPLFPATGNLWQTLQADTTLSLMAAALTACSPVINLDSMLSQGGIYTVFAPTNSAFIAAGYSSASAINSANPDSLAAIISYHIVPYRIFSCDWSSGQQLSSLSDSTFTSFVPVQGSNGYYQVQGKLNVTASNIIVGNVMAYNGVLHKIDQLMLP